MPVVLDYLILAALGPQPMAPAGSSTPFLPGGFLSGCDLNFEDQTYFLGLLDNSYPADYVEGLKSKPSGGYEIFQAAAKIGERLSIAVNRLECCAFVITAEGGVKSTGIVELYRAAPGTDPVTIKAGSVVTTHFGRDFVLTTDVVFGGADLGPHAVAVEAVDVGYEYNVQGQVIAANGETLEGEISVVKCWIATVGELASLDVLVRQIVPTEGGQPACLDGLAEDLDVFRFPFETDPEFRVRIKATQDTVSPAAICRGVNNLLRAVDPTFGCCLREVGTRLLPGIFYDAGSSADAPQDDRNNYAYDMEPWNRPEDRFKYYLNTIDMRGFFLLGIPPLVSEFNFGLVYDGSDADPFRKRNAYDTPEVDNGDAPYDGGEVFTGDFNMTLWAMVEEKRAGGVGFDFYVEEIGCF